LSEEPKLWPAILVAAVMVLSIAAVMFVGAENETAGPQLPEDYQLRYSASVVYEDHTVNGTQTVNQIGSSGEIVLQWDEGGYGGPIVWSGLNGGWMIEEVKQNTTWGTKYLRVCVGLGHGMDELPSIIIEYKGSISGLLYREDVITPDYRATFLLTGVNFTEILGMDMETSGRQPFQGYDDYFPDYPHHWDIDGGSNHAMARIEPGHDWYRMNATNYAFIYFSQENVWSMVEGGAYEYDEERSLIGNGTLYFQATGDWYIRQIWAVGEGPHHFIMDGALTAEE